jgi:hypothetical protein
MPSYHSIGNCDCCSRQHNPPSGPDFIVESSNRSTVSASYEIGLTSDRQSCPYVSSPIDFPHPHHEVDHSSSTVPPSSFPLSDSFSCREHPSRTGTGTINCNGMAAEQSPNSCRQYPHRLSSGEMSQTGPHCTLSSECSFGSFPSGFLPTPSTVSAPMRSQSLPVIIPPHIASHPGSRPSSPHPVA